MRSTAIHGGARRAQHEKMGVYEKEGYLENGKPVFKHAKRNEFLYSEEGSNRWLVRSENNNNPIVNVTKTLFVYYFKC